MASWMVATPCFASSATLAASARDTCFTAIPDCPIMGSPCCVNGLGYENFTAHDEPCGPQQRRPQHFSRVFGVHGQNHAEFAAWVVHRDGLGRARRHRRMAI